MIDGVRCCLSYPFVRKGACLQVKDDIRSAERWHLPGLELLGVVRGEDLGVGIGHGVDQVNLATAQADEAHLVSRFGLSHNAVEIGQAVAGRVGLKVVLEARQLRDVVALPSDQLERAAANGLPEGLLGTVRGDQTAGIIHHIGRKSSAGLM